MNDPCDGSKIHNTAEPQPARAFRRVKRCHQRGLGLPEQCSRHRRRAHALLQIRRSSCGTMIRREHRRSRGRPPGAQRRCMYKWHMNSQFSPSGARPMRAVPQHAARAVVPHGLPSDGWRGQRVPCARSLPHRCCQSTTETTPTAGPEPALRRTRSTVQHEGIVTKFVCRAV